MGRINESAYVNMDSRIPFDIYNLKGTSQAMEEKKILQNTLTLAFMQDIYKYLLTITY